MPTRTETRAPTMTDLPNGVAITGTHRSETLTGSGGDDALDGKGGNDRFHGGAGDDALTGGAGKDTFLFTWKLWGDDRILDFQAGEKVVLPRSVAGDTGNVIEHTHGEGGDTVIDFGPEQTVTLVGVDEGAFGHDNIGLI